MSNILKITVVGGEALGLEKSFDGLSPVLVGRSRSADLHLPEPDVSGRHFEFVPLSTGCIVRVMSRNGLVVDGRMLRSGDSAPVMANSVIEAGTRARIRVDAVPGIAESVTMDTSMASEPVSVVDVVSMVDKSGPMDGAASTSEVKDDGTRNNFTETSGVATEAVGVATEAVGVATEVRVDTEADGGDDAETAPDPPAPAPGGDGQFDGQLEGGQDGGTASMTMTGSEATGFIDGATNAEVEEGLTIAEDGETRGMETVVAPIDVINQRKAELDRQKVTRRLRIGSYIAVLILALVGVWLFLRWSSHTIDADGPYLENGEFDEVRTTLLNEEGTPEFHLLYPRNDKMTVLISPDSNSVEVATWFGKKSDVPFHMEFIRWNDRTELQRSLEDSFERWMLDETAKGSAFEMPSGGRITGEFFEDAYANWLEMTTLRGVRFIRAEFTRSRNRELWHGNCFYFRKGDRIHLLRLEIPDLFWKIAQRRVTNELHLGIYEAFIRDHWDSPGAAGLVGNQISDDELILRVRRELSAERVAAWPDLACYIDTLLVRSWGDKPRIQKEATSFYLQMQEHMARFYLERELALVTARANNDEKRMRAIVNDCKVAFAALPRDRRLSLVNNPEVWSCRPRSRRSL